jgi:pyrroline-5-carboxylate reductase
MGGALFEAWLHAGAIDKARSAVVDPNPSDRIADLCEGHGVALNPEADRGYEACVLAVKPQLFAAVLPDLDLPDMADTLFLSIAAGTSIETIGALMKERAPAARIVRTMPSLPASIGQGVTLLCAGGDVSEADRGVATRLMAAAGETYWCRDEDHLDQVMGVTGCSPAYVFLLAEALQDAAIERGVAPEDARRIAEASVTGAAAMLAQDGRDAAALRKAVTSPGGTTAAALGVLDDEARGFRPLAGEAVGAAYARAKELAR